MRIRTTALSLALLCLLVFAAAFMLRDNSNDVSAAEEPHELYDLVTSEVETLK